MKRYVAFLRGVSPMNAKMPALKRCFERAGFRDVVTLLSSGNVAFSAAVATPAALQRQVEAAMAAHLPRTFLTIIRPSAALQALLAADPFRDCRLPPGAKRVITFLRTPCRKAPALPISRHDATIYALVGQEVFGAYLPGENGPKFMTLIETTFGKDITTRTWDTVAKCARA